MKEYEIINMNNLPIQTIITTLNILNISIPSVDGFYPPNYKPVSVGISIKWKNFSFTAAVETDFYEKNYSENCDTYDSFYKYLESKGGRFEI